LIDLVSFVMVSAVVTGGSAYGGFDPLKDGDDFAFHQ